VSAFNLSGATALAAGWKHSLAVLSAGTDRAFGQNAQGQLGDGSTISRSSPVSVISISANAQP